MKLRSVAIILTAVTVAWSLVSVYSVWSQNQMNDPADAVWAEMKLPYQPSYYLALTNSSSLESILIEAVTHPGTWIYTPERGRLSALLDDYGFNVKYQNDYYRIGFSDADANPPEGILVWPPPTGLTIAGFIVLGATWTSVGAIKWNKRAKQQHIK